MKGIAIKLLAVIVLAAALASAVGYGIGYDHRIVGTGNGRAGKLANGPHPGKPALAENGSGRGGLQLQRTQI